MPDFHGASAISQAQTNSGIAKTRTNLALHHLFAACRFSAKLKEIESEQAAYIIELELKQINKVLSACQQRISFEKAEKERTEKLSSYSKTQS